MPLTRNAGTVRPSGTRTMSRAAGSASSLTLTRSTAATSPGVDRARPRTAAATRPARERPGTRSAGCTARARCRPRRRRPGPTPTSSAASRSAAATGPESPASMAPPGKAGWPACSRSSALRWMNSSSGPARPAVGEQDEHRRRPAAVGGRQGRRVHLHRLAASASSRSHARHRLGGLAACHENGPDLTSLAATCGSVGPSPKDGHSARQRARAAGGPRAVADPPAVPDHPLREDRSSPGAG